MTTTAPVLEQVPLDFLDDPTAPTHIVLPHDDAVGYLITGAARGLVVVGDTAYDLTHDVIPVMDEKHLKQLAYRVADSADRDGAFGTEGHTEPDPFDGAEMIYVMTNAHSSELLTYTLKGTAPTGTSAALGGAPASFAQGISTTDPGYGTTAAGSGDPTPQAVTYTVTAGSGNNPSTGINTASVTWVGLTAGTYAYTYFLWVATAVPPATTGVMTLKERWALSSAVQVLAGQSITAGASGLQLARG